MGPQRSTSWLGRRPRSDTELPQQGPARAGEQGTHESLWPDTSPATSAPPWCIHRAATASRTFVTLYYGVVIPGGRAVYIVLHVKPCWKGTEVAKSHVRMWGRGRAAVGLLWFCWVCRKVLQGAQAGARAQYSGFAPVCNRCWFSGSLVVKALNSTTVAVLTHV